MDGHQPRLNDIFPKTLAHLESFHPENTAVSEFPDWLEANQHLYQQYPFLPELARIELAVNESALTKPVFQKVTDQRVLNASLALLQTSWQGLAAYFNGAGEIPISGAELLLVFRPDESSDVVVAVADNQDLLALKIVAEDLDLAATALETGTSVETLNEILHQAAGRSLIRIPDSTLRRPEGFPGFDSEAMEAFRTTRYFTLQWHITQQCDLSCRHCYDRSDRKAVSLEQGLSVLAQLDSFCRRHHVQGQVSFTGGNPLLHPDFLTLYKEAAQRGFMTAILGNPMPETIIHRMVEIQTPAFFQISLEGLEAHNDDIRGKGSYRRAMDFLEVLQRQGLYSIVMLTLTRANLNDVLPLAEELRDRVDLFTFNRLAMVGEGAALASVEPAEFRGFLEAYAEAAADNPVLGFKDSLFNIVNHENGLPPNGGCTGFGCGAAFNFVSLLPDGEVHACRKFPSLIGNINQETLETIYHSSTAESYRSGSAGCSGCEIRPVCGGCLAVSYGFGQDIFSEVDPYCFFKTGKQSMR